MCFTLCHSLGLRDLGGGGSIKKTIAFFLFGFKRILHAFSKFLFCLLSRTEPTKSSSDVKQNNQSVLHLVKYCQCKRFPEATCVSLGTVLRGIATRDEDRLSLSSENEDYDS